MHINQDKNLQLYYQMLRIRMVEEAIADAYPAGKMRTPVHLSIGQEAVAAAAGMVLSKHDYAVSTHRSHAHYLAKGGSLKAMIAEIYGKVTGCCRGRGGSMHLIDQSVGFMGSTAIVGNTIPIGVGLGLAIQLEKSNRVSCIFIGDGAVEEGVFYESLNFAAVRKLPVLFICENNYYSVYTPFSKRQPKERKIYELANAIGANSSDANGYDVLESYRVLSKAVDFVKQGGGPAFVELTTYRWREHCGPNYDNDLGYRSVDEFEQWREKDPINLYKDHLQKQYHFDALVFQQIQDEIRQEIKESFDYAEQSDFPMQIEGVTGEYATVASRELLSCDA